MSVAEDMVPVANVSRYSVARRYVELMVERFPLDCLMNIHHENRRLGGISVPSLHDVDENDKHTFVLEHSEDLYPRLRVRTSLRTESVVEVANIIADPFGHEVFTDLINRHAKDGRFFFTTDFGQIPLKDVDMDSIWDLNGFPR